MKRTVALAASLLVLAGCSSSESKPSTGSGASSAPSSATTGAASTSAAGGSKPVAGASSVDCSDQSLSQAEWVENCSGSAPAGVTAPAGKSFTLSYSNMGGDRQYAAGVTITKMTCDSRPSYELTDQGAKKPLKPKAGHQFCRVLGTVKNVGKGPLDSTPVMAGVELADGTTFAMRSGGHATDSLEDWTTGSFLDEPLNPGSSINIADLYEVPSGSTPKFLIWSDGESGDRVQFALPTS